MLSRLFILVQFLSTVSATSCPLQDEYGFEDMGNMYTSKDITSSTDLFHAIDAKSNGDALLSEYEIRQYYKDTYKIPDMSAGIISRSLVDNGDTTPKDGHLSLDEFLPAFDKLLNQMSSIFQHMANKR